MVFGLIAAVVLARGSLIRFAFGQAELADGLGFVALARSA
jgi:hypothetical protein